MENLNLNQSLKTAEKANTKLLSFFDNPFVKYGFLIFAVLRIIFISEMDDYYLNLFNYPSVKIIYALLIAYSACFDPVYAVALTTLMIITIQELYARQAKRGLSTAAAPSGQTVAKPFVASALLDSSLATSLQLPADAKVLTSQPQSVVMDGMPDKAILINDALVYNEINKHSLQRTPDPKDTMIAEFDFYEDPAYRTITANLEEKNYLGRNKFFVTEENMNQIQTNQEPGVNQNAAVQAFPRVLNIQGLPNGFDKGVGGANPQLAAVGSN
jgi:hypothetical protein